MYRCAALAIFAAHGTQAVHDVGALRLETDQSQGNFSVNVDGSTWFASAAPLMWSKGAAASLKLDKFDLSKGTDPSRGNFVELVQSWSTSDDTPVLHLIRHFTDVDAIEFTTRFPSGMNDTSAGDNNAVSAAFTAFHVAGPAAGDPNERGYASWGGNMMADKFTKFGVWNEHATGMQGGIQGSLLAFFDAKAETSMVLSASSNFMAANYHRPLLKNTLYLGVMGGVTTIPVGYEMSFVLCASKHGPNAAFSKWGDFLLQKYGKDRSLRDSDYILNNLGYSTDNGAYYYYHVDNETGRWKQAESFEKTQIDVKAYADSEGIPYRYILLDSWWYPKDEHGGVTTWTADPTIYPHGLYSMWETTNLRVQGHNRYWSPHTPYAKQNGGDYEFIVEKEKSIPVEQRFWDDLFANATKWGLAMYEQDWLHNEFEGLKCTLESATLGREWLLQMGRGASNNGLTIQYCMVYPRFVLQSVEVPAVTNFRASDDYMPGGERLNWILGLSSIVADALALAPSKDNFWSTRTQPGNDYGAEEPYSELEAAICTYTAGPVAPSDMIGHSDASLIMRACDADGRLLKASRPAKSIDATFAFRAFGRDGPDGEVVASHSDIGDFRFYHILAANLKTPYSIKPSGLSPDASASGSLVFKHMPGNATAPASVISKPFSDADPVSLAACGKGDFQLVHTTPVLPNTDLVLLGELSKWVPLSPQRVQNIAFATEGAKNVFTISMRGASGEKVEMWFADGEGKLSKVACTLSHAGTATLTMPSGTCSGTSSIGIPLVV